MKTGHRDRQGIETPVSHHHRLLQAHTPEGPRAQWLSKFTIIEDGGGKSTSMMHISRTCISPNIRYAATGVK
jgi:hypothetical protein